MKPRKVVSLSVILSGICLVLASAVVAYAANWPGGQVFVDGIGPIDRYDILPGTTHQIQIYLPGWPDGAAKIKISSESTWTTCTFAGGSLLVPLSWTCPLDAVYCTTYTVQVKPPEGGPTYEIPGATLQVAHLHVIPEFAFGTGMSVTVLLGSLAAVSIYRKRK